MITINPEYAYNLAPCDHDGAKVRYPDGAQRCYVCWSYTFERRPKTQLAKCSLEMCSRSMAQAGLCLEHFESRRRRLRRTA